MTQTNRPGIGDHRAPESSSGFPTWAKKKITKAWKAIGGFIAASGASFAAQFTAVDWDNPTKTAVISLVSGLIGMLITYFMPSNKADS